MVVRSLSGMYKLYVCALSTVRYTSVDRRVPTSELRVRTGREGASVQGRGRGVATVVGTADRDVVNPPSLTYHPLAARFVGVCRGRGRMPGRVRSAEMLSDEKPMAREDDTTAEDMRVVLQEGLIQRKYRHQGLRASSSTVHGTGCFAEHGFATGQFVCDYFGDLVPRSIGTRGRDQVAEGIWGLNESYQIDPRRSHAPAAHTIGQWINHGCEPNLMSVVTNLRRNLCFTAAEAEVLRLPLQAESACASSAARPARTTRQRPPSDKLGVKRRRQVAPHARPDEGDGAETQPEADGDAQLVHPVDAYDVVCFIALREIAPGEELSYGYHRAVESAVCRCGAASCRGRY